MKQLHEIREVFYFHPYHTLQMQANLKSFVSLGVIKKKLTLEANVEWEVQYVFLTLSERNTFLNPHLIHWNTIFVFLHVIILNKKANEPTFAIERM